MSSLEEEEPESGEGVLVDSGSFRLDRSQALTKLMRFQLPDPGMYLLLLARCAVASEATELSIRRGARGSLQIVFDGHPFTKAGMEYPYASLFDAASPRNRRDRELAVALVAAMRLEPKSIVLRSGRGADRIRLVITSLESDTLTEFPEPSSETVLTIEKGGHELLRSSYVQMLERCCQLSPIPIKIDGEPLPKKLRGGSVEEHTFDVDGIRGWIALPPSAASASSIDVYRYGVFLSALQRTLTGGQVVGAVNDDALTANASQSGVVRNKRLDKTLGLLSVQVGRLIKRLCERQDEQILRINRLLLADPAAAERWRRGVERGGAERPEGFFSRLAGLAAALAPKIPDARAAHAIDEALRRTLWLRGAADSLLADLDSDSKDEVKSALWNAALHMDVSGAPLSFAELERQRRHLGHVPYSRVLHAEAEPGFRALWLASTDELERLKRRLGGVFNDVSPVLADAARRAKTSPLAKEDKPRLSRLGLSSENLLIHTLFQAGEYEGEIALPVHRLAHGARVHVFRPHGAAAFFDLPGHLRFHAAVSGLPASGRAPAALVDILSKAAVVLYRKLADEYKPGRGGGRDEHIRRHLVDFAAWAVQGGPARAEKERWALLTPIFRSADALWNFERLRAAFDEGRTLFFARSLPTRPPVSPIFFDSLFTAEYLQGLFPDSRAGAFPPLEDGMTLYKPVAGGCGHDGDCLFEWTAGKTDIHLAPAPGRGGAVVETDWGPVRVFGPVQQADRFPPEAAARFLEAFLRQIPEAASDRGHAYRPLMLKALRRFFAGARAKPQIGDEEARIAALALAAPVIPLRGGRMASLGELGVGLRPASGAEAISTSGQHPNLPLDPGESELVGLFWPDPLKVFKAKAAAKPAAPLPDAPVPAETPAQAKRRAPPREKPAFAPSGDLVVDALRLLLADLKGRRGIALEGYPDPAQVDAAYMRRQAGAEDILASSIPPEAKAAYLASIIYTGLNRAASKVTDEDDAHFQRALTAALAKSLPGSA